uniref:G-protein coupled receptors family 1 profile domain-containing protein n=1 Tax=Trichobilharzia regenti TaxID=157069 RepID=A0AA85KPR0_TRIRE|nr:unnamed protein product [Trichobilharzia regenti]
MSLKINSTDFYTPLDTLIDCILLEQGHPNASKLVCEASKIFGNILAYAFPCIGVLNLTTNTIVAVIFLYSIHQKNLQFLFLGLLALSDIGITIIIGWLRLFPTYGLPFASSGGVYYFIMTRSSISCKLVTFAQAFCCTLRGNILLLLAVIRFILMHRPLAYNRLSTYPSWIFITGVVFITFLMSLPIGIIVDMTLVFKLSMCWFTQFDDILIAYQVLFSNTCIVQLSLTLFFNVFFVLKVVKWTSSRRQTTSTNSTESKKNISTTITLLVLHTFTFLCALPCGISFLLTILFDPTSTDVSVEFLRLVVFILNIGWVIIFLQSSLNILLYTVRISIFRQTLCKVLRNVSVRASSVNRVSVQRSFT